MKTIRAMTPQDKPRSALLRESVVTGEKRNTTEPTEKKCLIIVDRNSVR